LARRPGLCAKLTVKLLSSCNQWSKLPINDIAEACTRISNPDGNASIGIPASWNEFDLDAALWVIPASRMKGRKSFRVPLSSRAMEILKTLADIRTAPWLFPNRSGRNAIAPRPLNILLPDNVSAHGFRSSFRSWVADDPAERFGFDLAELALAHAVGGQVERSYLRGDGLLKRVALMQAWCDYLGGAR
jgi:integrase